MSTTAGWVKWHAWNAATVKPVTEWIVRAAAASAGMRALDVGCGTGMPSLAVAAAVGPSGHVVAVDKDPGMIAATATNAAVAGHANVEVREMNADQLGFADASFDVVTSCFMLMFCPDPLAVAKEMRRVLKPGGRLALAVWDERGRNPVFTEPVRALARHVPVAPPDPTTPGQFFLGPPGRLADLLRAAGFVDLREETVPLMFDFASLDQQFEMFGDMAPLLRNAAATLSPAELAQIRASFAEVLAPFMAGPRVRVPASARCAVVTSPPRD